jgi:WD40 repeat protein
VFDPGLRWVASAGYQNTAGAEFLVVHHLTAAPARRPPPEPDIARALGVEPEPIFSRLWDYPNVVFDPCFDGGLAGTLAASADGRLVAGSAVEWGGAEEPADELFVWNVATGEYRRAAVPARPDALAFSPDGRWLVGVRSGGLDRWDVATLARQTWQRRQSPAGPLRFSPDGTVLACAVPDGVALLDMSDGATAPTVRTSLPIPATDLAFHPNGRLLTAGQDGIVRIWDTGSGNQLAALDWSAGPLHSLAVAPNGLTCAAGGENGQVVVWDADG